MKILDDYFKLEKEIHEYFGYEEGWVVIPIDDSREHWWELKQEENGGGIVRFANKEEELWTGEDYENDIYTQRHLLKYVYRGKDYTMVSVDTHTDGNKFLQIFDNKKEIEEK